MFGPIIIDESVELLLMDGLDVSSSNFCIWCFD